MNFDKLIDKTESYCDKTLTLEKTLNVAYCFDNDFSLCCGVSLFSLLENNKEINLVIHLFVLSLSDDNKIKFSQLISHSENTHLYIYYVNNEFQINSHNQKRFPLSASLRVITPEILKDKCDYFLYLDSDTLVVDSLIDLLNFQNDKTISAVIDVDAFIVLRDRVDLPTGLYFNSGVLLINNQKWVKHKITEKVIDLLFTGAFAFPDQDALNTILNNDCNYLPVAYNESSINKTHNIYYRETNVKIIHYTGYYKPYFKLFSDTLCGQYLKKSPWSTVNLKIAINSSMFRVYARTFVKNNKCKALKLYCMYLFFKLKELLKKSF